jgi:hypothetical protein
MLSSSIDHSLPTLLYTSRGLLDITRFWYKLFYHDDRSAADVWNKAMNPKQQAGFSLPKSISQSSSLRNGRSIFYHWGEQLQALPASPCIAEANIDYDVVPGGGSVPRIKTLSAVRAQERRSPAKHSSARERKAKQTTANLPLAHILPAPMTPPRLVDAAESTTLIAPSITKNLLEPEMAKKNTPTKVKRKAKSVTVPPVLLDDEWRQYFGLLKTHKETHGTCIVRQHHSAAPVRKWLLPYRYLIPSPGCIDLSRRRD